MEEVTALYLLLLHWTLLNSTVVRAKVVTIFHFFLENKGAGTLQRGHSDLKLKLKQNIWAKNLKIKSGGGGCNSLVAMGF